MMERRSLGRDVFECLKDAIADQVIKPGERLVESRIADMLSISRTPLREALHKLESQEWIEKNPSGGYRVARVTGDDIEQIFEIKKVLAAYAAGLAARNHTKKDLIRLEEKAGEYRACLEKGEINGLQKINAEFRDLLYAFSNNPRLIKMIDQLQNRIAIFRKTTLEQDRFLHEDNDDPIRMLPFIRNRDEAGVEHLVRHQVFRYMLEGTL